MLKINVPDAAWSEQSVSLGGLEYSFVFTFNTRDERWRLNIYYQGSVVVEGLKIVENGFLLYRYNTPNFSHGDLACIRIKRDNLPVGRDNFGFDKAYELIYFTNEELNAI